VALVFLYGFFAPLPTNPPTGNMVSLRQCRQIDVPNHYSKKWLSRGGYV